MNLDRQKNKYFLQESGGIIFLLFFSLFWIAYYFFVSFVDTVIESQLDIGDSEILHEFLDYIGNTYLYVALASIASFIIILLAKSKNMSTRFILGCIFILAPLLIIISYPAIFFGYGDMEIDNLADNFAVTYANESIPDWFFYFWVSSGLLILSLGIGVKFVFPHYFARWIIIFLAISGFYLIHELPIQ